MDAYQGLVERINFGSIDSIEDGVNFDHRKFMDLPDGKIIFTEEVFQQILLLLRDTKLLNQEFGMFLYGHRLGKNFYFIDTVARNRFLSYDKEIVLSEKAVDELDVNISCGYDVIIHFHTHPDIEGCCSRNYSDQDLFMYGVLEKRFQPSHGKIDYFGGLGCFCFENSEINFVKYDNLLEKFQKIQDIYFVSGNDMKKINSIDSIPTISYDTVKRVSSLEKGEILKQIDRI